MNTTDINYKKRKRELEKLVAQFAELNDSGNLDKSSEATARTWIERFLEIFGWDSGDPSQIDQESTLSETAKRKNEEIESAHTHPDYAFMRGTETIVYLDAKKINVNIESDKAPSFQIRSYGWSSGDPCGFLSNFAELAIYDTRFKPSKGQSTSVARKHYFKYHEYVDNFDVLHKHFWKESVQNNGLSALYSDRDLPKGSRTLDEDFADHLSVWRVKLANSVYKSNRRVSIEELQTSVQSLMDQLVFLRICEGKGVEPFGELKKIFEEKDSSKLFQNRSLSQYEKRYGGHLFSSEKNRAMASFSEKLLKDFVDTLYYPYPYRFEVIPVNLLGNVYERYLGKNLLFQKGKIVDDFKPEYSKSKGAVYTPPHIVYDICSETLSPLVANKDPYEFLPLKVIDPSCGSGSFLLGVFDFLEAKVLGHISQNRSKLKSEYLDWFWEEPHRGRAFLTVAAKHTIIEKCLHGVDIDSQAVEISKLSLSLKVLEHSEVEPAKILGISGTSPRILDSLGTNLRVGNALVDSTIFEYYPELADRNHSDDLRKVLPFDWDSKENGFHEVFNKHKGFDAVVGNPPYIEVKHYKKHSPFTHRFLTQKGEDKIYKTTGSGKVDLAMPFIEKALSILNPSGRMGFIVQNRFFKTDYGKPTRTFLAEQKCISKIIDFSELKVFIGRSTYTCILICDHQKKNSFSYTKVGERYEENPIHELTASKGRAQKIAFLHLEDGIWSFDYPEVLTLKEQLLKRFKAIKDIENMNIRVGTQVLWDKIYHIRPKQISGKTIVGLNQFGETVNIEKAACRPLICNEEFYSYRPTTADSYIVFPYDIDLKNLQDRPIPFRDFQKRFPKAGEYLKKNKRRLLKEGIEHFDGDQEWHLYTRKNNNVTQALPKVLIPSTIVDSVATVDGDGAVYQDNVRVNALQVEGATENQYWAISCIINSNVFNCLSLVTRAPLQKGHSQLNKQFLEPIPFPLNKIVDNQLLTRKLSDIARSIQHHQERYVSGTGQSRSASKAALKTLWSKLNEVVENEVYALDVKEKEIVKKYPRMVDSVELLEDVGRRAA